MPQQNRVRRPGQASVVLSGGDELLTTLEGLCVNQEGGCVGIKVLKSWRWDWLLRKIPLNQQTDSVALVACWALPLVLQLGVGVRVWLSIAWAY